MRGWWQQLLKDRSACELDWDCPKFICPGTGVEYAKLEVI